jgi:type III secretion system FlhB-like substrate exporter
MKPYQKAYVQDFETSSDLTHYAETVIEAANAAQKPITQSPDKVKHMISHDIRHMLPPQLYELIGLIASAVEEATEQATALHGTAQRSASVAAHEKNRPK